MSLSWKTKRVGSRYCAPACGHGCTWGAYQKAKRDAAALALRCGPGWKPRVWENMGWHHSAIRGDSQVYTSYCYWCSLMLGGCQFIGEDRDPRKAIAKAELEARRHVNTLLKGLAEWEASHD